VLRATAEPFFGAERRRVQRGHRIGAIAETTPERPVDARARIEPGRRHDHGVDEWPLDAVEHGRFVPLVDDANRHEQHAGAEVQGGVNEEVQVRLLQLQLAALFQALDDRVFELELADEAQPLGEAVAEEQHEAMEVERGRGPVGRPVQMEVHVAGDRPRRGCRLGAGWRLCHQCRARQY
jgi:hypothetical protein